MHLVAISTAAHHINRGHDLQGRGGQGANGQNEGPCGIGTDAVGRGDGEGIVANLVLGGAAEYAGYGVEGDAFG